MGVGAGLYMYYVVVKKFTFAISSPDEFLVCFIPPYGRIIGILSLLCVFVCLYGKKNKFHYAS